MDPPRQRIDQLRQRIDIGRKQLAQPAIFQDHPDHRMAVGKHLQVLLVGTVLFGFGHFRFRVDLHAAEKRLAQLFGRIDVQRRIARRFTDTLLEGRQLPGQLLPKGGQRSSVDLHAGHFDVGEHRNQRLLDLRIEFGQSRLHQQRPQHTVKPQRHVGILGGIGGHRRHRHHIHRFLLGPLTDQRLDRHRIVPEERAGEMVHAVPRLGVEQVMDDHRIVEPAPHLDAGTAQHHQVEFDVLADFRDLLVGKDRTQCRDHTVRVLPVARDIPCLVRFDRDRNSD